MVKPPKTMEPSAITHLSKKNATGRDRVKAFQDDSFHIYMARKIELQRKQFGGSTIPPPPPAAAAAVTTTTTTTAVAVTTSGKTVQKEFQQQQQQQSIVEKSKHPYHPMVENQEQQQQQHQLLQQQQQQQLPKNQSPSSIIEREGTTTKTKTKKRKKQFGVSALVKRLQQKHSAITTTTTDSASSNSYSIMNSRMALTATSEMTVSQHATILLSKQYIGSSSSGGGGSGSSSSSSSSSSRKRSRSFITTTSTTTNVDDVDDRMDHNSNDENDDNNPMNSPDFQSPIVSTTTSNRQQQMVSAATTTTKATVVTDCDIQTTPTFDKKHNDDSCSTNVDITTTTTSRIVPTTNTTSSNNKKTKISIRPDLFFTNIVIFVNGYTDPDNETLQRLVQKHGGMIERYETSCVTHIIAQQLSLAKANVYKKQKQCRPIVLPQWIVDSIQAYKLLPYQNYILRDVKLYNNIPSVASVFQQHQRQQPKESPEIVNCDDNSKNRPTTSAHNSTSITTCYSRDDDIEQKDSWLSNNQKVPEERIVPQAKVEATSTNSKATTSSSPSGGYMKNGVLRTTGTDPNFLESFFASSRLSFIGSYRQRSSSTNATSTTTTKQHSSVAVTSEGGTNNNDRTGCERLIYHVDMDCFFASVALRNYPQYRDAPVVISHNGRTAQKRNPNGQQSEQQHIDRFQDSSSECATCNYEARKYGIKKGMFLGRAKTLCPNLIVLPYDYDGYEEVSDMVTQILHRYAASYSGFVEQVSCDEAYMEVYIPKQHNDIELSVVATDIAESIRDEIFTMSQCTASIGIGTNKFLAKIGTDHIKPNRSYFVQDFRLLLQKLKLRDMHGIGYKMRERLEVEGLVHVQDVWDLADRAESELCRILGPGLGKKVFGYCHGKDDRTIQATERKTIGAECNYGVRFDGPYGVDYMIEGLCKEVEKRMTNVGVKGKKVTLKVKQRKHDAPQPPKFLGHGSCHNLSKSAEVSTGEATRTWKTFYNVAMELYHELQLCKNDVRGMGIVISKLVEDDTVDLSNTSPKQSIAKWFNGNTAKKDTVDTKTSGRKVNFLLPPSKAEEDCFEIDDGKSVEDDEISSTSDVVVIESTAGIDGTNEHDDIALPSFSQIHMSQVNELPSPMRKQIIFRMESDKNWKPMMAHIDNTRPAAISTRDVRFRQVDVKRMFRLASVKSGEAELCDRSGQAISLTQLECLPLELQLEIANEDTNGIGSIVSPERKVRSKTRAAMENARDVNKKSPPTKSASVQSNNTYHFDGGNDCGLKTSSQDVRNDGSPELDQSSTFVRDNIIPLKAYMDDHPNVDDDSLQCVAEFLCVCVSENRLSDTELLLKTIRQHDLNSTVRSWSKHGFDIIFDIVNQQVLKHYRASLDKEWVVYS